uniref:A4_EXTRA domain-containing protein n=1 Tax=Trichobilharzia regenti TaxID=157069 RepID=A0AA85JVM0_TRIRE|nr:unnamed protein product [Trichobilharzia regenti]
MPSNLIIIFVFFKCIALAHSLYSVAFECGKPSIYLNNQLWVTDHTQGCLNDEVSILKYCNKVYSERNITKVVAAPPIDINLSDWCEFTPGNLEKCQNLQRERYEIKPFICLDSVPMSTLFVPNGCQLSSLDNDHTYLCENHRFWEDSARNSCHKRNMRYQNYLPLKPCIKQEDFSAIHFTAAKVVCCAMSDSSKVPATSVPYSKDVNNSVLNKIHVVDDKAVSAENVSSDDKNFINYLAFSNQKSPSGLLVPERERYSKAKQAVSNALHNRENVLKQEFVDAESLISDEDWQNNPVKSQLAEDSLIQEFLSKFIGLENESERDRKSLEMVHRQRIENQLLERRRAIVDAWERAINTEKPNNFTLFEMLKRLLQVIEHDRSHFVKRLERLRTTDPSEAIRQLPSIKESLVSLDILLNESLEKLNMHPKLMPDLLTYAKRLQQDKYGKLEAELKSIAIASVALPDSIKLPTFQEQASLKAEKVVAKYRHHLEPLSSSSSSENSVNNNVMNKSRNKSVNRQKKLMVLFNPMNLSKSKDNSIWFPHIKTTTMATKTTTATTMATTTPNLVDFASESVLSTVDYSSYKSVHSTSRSGDNQILENETNSKYSTGHYTTDNTVLFNSTSSLNNTSMHLSNQSQGNKAAYISLIILGVLFTCICLLLITRRYLASLRYNRKGYTLTVVEVDEVITPKMNDYSPEFLPVRKNRRRHHHHQRGRPFSSSSTSSISKQPTNHDDDVIHNWQMNGYENPAYKFTTNHTNKRFIGYPSGNGMIAGDVNGNTDTDADVGGVDNPFHHDNNSFDDFEI